MKYLLDTNTCIRFINGRAPNVRLKLLLVANADIVVSSITKAEMFFGSAKSQTPLVSREKQDEFFKRFESLPFDDSAASIYGNIRWELARVGMPISAYDMLIAAIALANNLTLVTHNTKEFSRIRNLTTEDWEI